MSAEDVSEATFGEKVLARSATVPVVVDFWAPWCGPCRVLGPVLEAEVEALGGRVTMVKVNTDESPNLSAELGIRGIPAVKAYRNGQIVSEFVGARPAAFVRSWLGEIAPSPGAETLERATRAAAEGRIAEAEPLLRGLVDDPETRDQARLRLARLLVASGRAAEAKPLLAGIDARSTAADAVPGLERLIALVERAGGDEAEGADAAAHYATAGRLVGRGDLAGALEHLLEVVGRDRKLDDDGARLAMLAIFDLLGHDHPLTQELRRRLQIVL